MTNVTPASYTIWLQSYRTNHCHGYRRNFLRDGFYIEAKDNTVTVISADPNSYSTARTNTGSSTTSPLSFSSGGPGADTGGGGGGGDDKCIGCVGGSGGGAGVGNNRWTEVRPN